MKSVQNKDSQIDSILSDPIISNNSNDLNNISKNSIFTKQHNCYVMKNKEIDKNKYEIETSDSNLVNDLQMTLSLKDIIESIPTNAVTKPILNLQSTHTEWRWRFFDFNGRTMIEMSKLSPFTDRQYMDNKGKWISYDLDNNWDKYVVDIKYYYAK